MNNDLIFGKNNEQCIVSIEICDEQAELFIQEPDGSITSKIIENRYWILANRALNDKFKRLQGDLYYKYMITTKHRDLFLEARKDWKNRDIYSIHNPKEAFMVLNGLTYFKGLKHNEISILSFDIETTGLKHDDESKVLLISNTYRDSFGKITRKLFAYDEHNSQGEMLKAWCNWVREMNPSILAGHNIFGFDLKYLQFIADQEDITLDLGRDNSPITFNKYITKYRVDGSRTLDYKSAQIYGREIIDTMFLSYKFGATKNYESYGLKSLIKAEGLDIKDREYYDASQIRFNYKKPIEWEKIKRYCIHDSDEALALFDLMNSSYFYFSQHIPKSYQSIIESATGSQLNSFLVRSYLQENHSIPKTSPLDFNVEGGISFAVPGIYKNMFKIDLLSAYPSQILRFKLFDNEKDPNGNFYNMVHHFAYERFELKKKFKETSNIYYKNRDASAKIFLNSAYGLTNTPGLNFNSQKTAAKITKETRDVIKMGLLWASGKDLNYWQQLFEEKT